MIEDELALALVNIPSGDFARIALGIVTGPSTTAPTTNVLVNISGASVDAPVVCSAYAAPAVNDPVLVAIQSSRIWVIGALKRPALAFGGAQPPPAVPPPSQTGSPDKPLSSGEVKTGNTTFPPTDAGSYRDGKFWTRDAIYQSKWSAGGDSTGLWTYSGSITGSLKGAVVTNAAIYLHRRAGGDYAAKSARLHTASDVTMPGGMPSAVTYEADSQALAIDQAAWVPFPTAAAQKLVDGTANSVAITGTGQSQYWVGHGLASDGQSGSISIAWKRTG